MSNIIEIIEYLIDRHTGKIVTGVMLSGFVTVFAIMTAISGYTCSQRWAESGTESRFKITTGCQVQRANGTWVSESIIRDVDL